MIFDDFYWTMVLKKMKKLENYYLGKVQKFYDVTEVLLFIQGFITIIEYGKIFFQFRAVLHFLYIAHIHEKLADIKKMTVLDLL